MHILVLVIFSSLIKNDVNSNTYAAYNLNLVTLLLNDIDSNLTIMPSTNNVNNLDYNGNSSDYDYENSSNLSYQNYQLHPSPSNNNLN